MRGFGFRPSIPSPPRDIPLDALAGSLVPALQEIGRKADQEAREKTKGFELGYELFSINGRIGGHGDPVRVNRGSACCSTRITMRRVLEILATYADRRELFLDYPDLEEEDLKQALIFAAAVVDDEIVEFHDRVA